MLNTDFLLCTWGDLWLRSVEGSRWLQKKDGREWLQTADGEKWAADKDNERKEKERLRNFFSTSEGRKWLASKSAKEWLLNNGFSYPLWFDAIGELSPERWAEAMLESNSNWLLSKEGKEWLETDEGVAWSNTVDGIIMTSYLNHYHKYEVMKNRLSNVALIFLPMCLLAKDNQ